ncbi:MAG: alpha/beta fold hydrolase, partial [Pseudomonadota bacterium]
EPEAYRTDVMADDIVRLLTHLGATKAALLGYSMGARISAFTALKVPERLSAVVLSGLAANLVKGVGGGPQIADGLEAENAASVTDPTARAFRAFAEQTGSDKRALAACMRASRQLLSAEDVGRIAVPTLVVAGDQDEIAGSADWLAARIPGAKAVNLPGRDHMTAVGDKGHKEAVLAFLSKHAG